MFFRLSIPAGVLAGMVVLALSATTHAAQVQVTITVDNLAPTNSVSSTSTWAKPVVRRAPGTGSHSITGRKLDRHPFAMQGVRVAAFAGGTRGTAR